jgi:hypothetical protein
MVREIVILLSIFAFVLILLFSGFGARSGKIYDCRDAHWHPDVPVDVKKECQQLMLEELKKLREQEKKKLYV